MTNEMDEGMQRAEGARSLLPAAGGVPAAGWREPANAKNFPKNFPTNLPALEGTPALLAWSAELCTA